MIGLNWQLNLWIQLLLVHRYGSQRSSHCISVRVAQHIRYKLLRGSCKHAAAENMA